jgi:hypothetical protein
MPVGGIGLAEANQMGQIWPAQTHGTREPWRTQSESMVETKALGPLPPTRLRPRLPRLDQVHPIVS